MKDNYQAWQIDIDSFPNDGSIKDQFKFLINFAILAPSSHNSQPWKFRIDDSNIWILPNFKRALPVSDPQSRHLYISIGCAVENLLIAADYYGFKANIKYPIAYSDGVRVFFGEKVNQPVINNSSNLIFFIPVRSSNRSRYDNRMPDDLFLKKALSFSSEEILVTLITEEQKKIAIADLLMRSRLKAFDNRAFRKELAGYKRTNLTRSPLGMPGFTMGFSSLISLFAPIAIRIINVMKIVKKKEERILKNHTPLFIILSTKEDYLLSWIKTGRVLERLMLEAQRHHIQSSMSAIPSDVKELQNILDTRFRPQIFLRMGYTDIIPGHSPRLGVNKVLEGAE